MVCKYDSDSLMLKGHVHSDEGKFLTSRCLVVGYYSFSENWMGFFRRNKFSFASRYSVIPCEFLWVLNIFK